MFGTFNARAIYCNRRLLYQLEDNDLSLKDTSKDSVFTNKQEFLKRTSHRYAHTHTQKGKKRICNWLVEDLHLLKALKRKRNSFENSSPNVGCRDSFLKIKQLYKEGNNMVEIKVQFLFHLFDFGTFHALATYNLALP